MRLDSNAQVSENDQENIYVREVSLLQFARSGLFLWHTFELLLVGSAEIFVLFKYWNKLSEMHVVILVCVVGITLTIGPYVSLSGIADGKTGSTNSVRLSIVKILEF